jgi:hypothetical protein
VAGGLAIISSLSSCTAGIRDMIDAALSVSTSYSAAKPILPPKPPSRSYPQLLAHPMRSPVPTSVQPTSTSLLASSLETSSPLRILPKIRVFTPSCFEEWSQSLVWTYNCFVDLLVFRASPSSSRVRPSCHPRVFPLTNIIAHIIYIHQHICTIHALV